MSIAEAPVWTMPTVRRGQDVLWYHAATRGSNPEMGKVVGVSTNCIDILIAGAGGVRMKASVHHMDDPALAGNVHLRNPYGGWEHTEQTKFEERDIHGEIKQLKAFAQWAEEKIKQLESSKGKKAAE